MNENRVKKIRKNQKGFTLIELLVVIGIVGILAAALMPSFSGFRDDAMKSNVESELRLIVSSIDSIIARDGGLPLTTDDDDNVIVDEPWLVNEVDRLLGLNSEYVEFVINSTGADITNIEYSNEVNNKLIQLRYTYLTDKITLR